MPEIATEDVVIKCDQNQHFCLLGNFSGMQLFSVSNLFLLLCIGNSEKKPEKLNSSGAA